MSSSRLPLPAIDEVRQANRLFLDFLRSRPAIASEHFGLSSAANELLCRASRRQVDRAADFPRALFRLHLPATMPGPVHDPLGPASEPARRVLQVTLLMCAWNLSRTSGYSARLLLRLDDETLHRFRHAELRDILALSEREEVLRAAFDELDGIWQPLLTASQPEQRRRLFLIGLQPDRALYPASGMA